MALELPHQLLHPAAGAEDMHPVVQHALYLKGTACLLARSSIRRFASQRVILPGIQQLPFLTAEGQGKDLSSTSALQKRSTR